MSGDLHLLDSQLAVVPIVVNAGAAMLPAILAAIGSFVAILFKPRELASLCRAKPWVPVLVVAIAATLTAGLWVWPARGPFGTDVGRRRAVASAPGEFGTVVNIDWTKIALARIQAMEQKGAGQGAVPAEDTGTAPTSSAEAFTFRAGPERLGCLGEDLCGPMEKAWHYYPRWVDASGVEHEDTDAMVMSSPAYRDGRVYGASCLLDPPYNYGAVFCLDAVTGEQIWSLDSMDGKDIKGFFSSPALTADGRYLLIGQGLHPDSDCHLLCIDTETGEIHWALLVTLHIESSPAIDGDIVYVGCGAIEDPSTRQPVSHPGFVLAVRISDGQELWRYDVPDPESSPVVVDGVLYIGSGFNGRAVVALDVETDQADRLLWRTDTRYPITGAITLARDTVIAGGGNGDFVYRDPNPAGIVLALNKGSGEVRWSADVPDAVLGAVAATPSLVCPVASGEVMALDPATGEPQWATSISGSAPVLAACAVAGQSVYAVSQDGYLARLDLASGEVLEKQYINSTERPGAQGLSVSSPLVAHGRLYVGSETGGLRCYRGTAQP